MGQFSRQLLYIFFCFVTKTTGGRASLCSPREDDDINDVASMAGVNLKEESVRILAGGGLVIGSVVQSCQDTPFLSTGALHARILRTGTPPRPPHRYTSLETRLSDSAESLV